MSALPPKAQSDLTQFVQQQPWSSVAFTTRAIEDTLSWGESGPRPYFFNVDFTKLRLRVAKLSYRDA